MSGTSRRTFVRQAALLVAGASAAPWARLSAADAVGVTAATSNGSVRGLTSGGINVFKGIHYGGTTAGKNRFMPPTRPVAVDRHARRARVRADRAADDRRRWGARRRPDGKRRLPGAERLHAGPRRRPRPAGDGVAARRRLLDRVRIGRDARRHQPRAARATSWSSRSTTG